MLIEFNGRQVDFRPWKPSRGRVFAAPFALDVETVKIIGHEPPDYVMGAATDGVQGVFLAPDAVADFLAAHWGPGIIFHRCSFDLAVLNKLLKSRAASLDVYRLIDERRVWDTLTLHKLYGLATLGHTHQGQGQSTLERCASLYLGLELPKDVRDAAGNDVRTSWGLWQGRPPNAIPPVYLEYLARDALCTFAVFEFLHPAVHKALDAAPEAFGHVDQDWLTRMTSRYGVQTHDLQVMGAVALDAVERVGIGLDLANRNETVAQVRELADGLKEGLRPFGYLAGEEGSGKALQSLIRKALADHPQLDVPKTATGKFSTKREHLDELAEASEFFARLKEYDQVSDLLSNCLEKMSAARLHPHYDPLKNTGRTSASAPNIQSAPRKRKRKKPGPRDAFDVRRCFAPAPGKVFYVVDYSCVELRTLAQALMTQFGLDSVMARKLNSGVDLHRFVAARLRLTGHEDAPAILADEHRYAEFMASLTDEERGAAKPANFGLPAGMGAKALRDYAQAQFEESYTEEDAAGWKRAWLASFPEMNEFLRDNLGAGLLLAQELNLTPGDYSAATGLRNYSPVEEQAFPAGWAGYMALKVLRDPSPATASGWAYTTEVLDYYWDRLQPLAARLGGPFREHLQRRRPGQPLFAEVKKLIDKAGVLTITGRLRAKASYSARRNTVFQGAASDGAKLALYRLWRDGFTVVAFIHDEVVVEVDETADLPRVKKQIDDILIASMSEICPDVKIEVEGSFRRRWGKDKEDEVRLPERGCLAS
jgi:DNA polymerase I-like protein with 3'-5' exonuclease and polymerase domains